MFATTVLLTTDDSQVIVAANLLRQVSNFASIFATLALLSMFHYVPRMRKYPTLLIKDAAFFCFVFSTFHLVCSIYESELTVFQDEVIYFVVNCTRLAGRSFCACVAMIVYRTIGNAQRTRQNIWDAVEYPSQVRIAHPSLPFLSFPHHALTEALPCPSQSDWSKWHMRARCASCVYGLVVTMFFALVRIDDHTNYLGCWFRYGKGQIYADVVATAVFNAVLLKVLVFSQLNPAAKARFLDSNESRDIAAELSRMDTAGMASESYQLISQRIQDVIWTRPTRVRGTASSVSSFELSGIGQAEGSSDETMYVLMPDDATAGHGSGSAAAALTNRKEKPAATAQNDDSSPPDSTSSYRALLSPPRTSFKFLAGVLLGCELARGLLTIVIELSMIGTHMKVYENPTVVYILFILGKWFYVCPFLW